jgi:hypothetical protein
MQTISLPYRVIDGDPTQLTLWRWIFSAAVRSGYRAAGTGAPEKEIRDGLKQRFASQGIDAWLPDPPAAVHRPLFWGTGGYYAHSSHGGYGSAGLLGFIIIVLIVVWLFDGFGTSVYHY